MNTDDFEANLKADGYSEIETQNLQPRPGKGHHGHHFSIRGLVLAGTFTVTRTTSASPTVPEKSSQSRKATRMTKRSVRRVLACWSDENIEMRKPIGSAKAPLAPCPPFFESDVLALNGGYAYPARIRATRWLCPPYDTNNKNRTDCHDQESARAGRSIRCRGLRIGMGGMAGR
jgi:hypothetical protein